MNSTIDKDKILVVDLDGTLIHSDMLHESFWNAFSNDWKTIFKAFRAFFSGKAKLKEYLAHTAKVDVESLPYNKTVIDYIKKFREHGGRTALVTATHHLIAEKIATHLGIFDEVHGSSGTCNLKGKNKAAFLVQTFGKKKFLYIGDSRADIPVWSSAAKAITVNASARLKKSCAKANPVYEHLQTIGGNQHFLAYWQAIRPHQWIKNVLVFTPMFAAHQFHYSKIFESLIAFFVFSIIASSVYIINDLIDLDSDRAHSRKHSRPFACGAVPILHGEIAAALLFLIGILVAFFTNQHLLIVLLVYYVLTFSYSLFLKRKIIIDIFALACLYTIRMIGGAVSTQIELTFWLLSFSMLLFLSLAAVKRQGELVDLKKQRTRQIKGRGYGLHDLPIVVMVAINAGYLSVLVLALYLNSEDVIALYQSPSLLFGLCGILLFWISRIVMITNRGKMHDDPIIYAMKDKVSLICFVMFIIIFVAGNLDGS